MPAVNSADPAVTSTVTRVSASVTSVELLASTTFRYKVTIYNDSTSDLYVLLGSGTANTTNNFTVKLCDGGTYETPERFVGAIQGIWDTAAGGAQITELT